MIFAEPLKAVPFIFLEVSKVVAVSAFPVTSPVKLPVTLPVTLPVKLPLNVAAVIIPDVLLRHRR